MNGVLILRRFDPRSIAQLSYLPPIRVRRIGTHPESSGSMTDARVPEPDKPAAHWPTIEADYRAGVKSVRQIASEHGISEGAVRKSKKPGPLKASMSGSTKQPLPAICAVPYDT